jgi:hypothetical protein
MRLQHVDARPDRPGKILKNVRLVVIGQGIVFADAGYEKARTNGAGPMCHAGPTDLTVSR